MKNSEIVGYIAYNDSFLNFTAEHPVPLTLRVRVRVRVRIQRLLVI
jgi:hypothetical protein